MENRDRRQDEIRKLAYFMLEETRHSSHEGKKEEENEEFGLSRKHRVMTLHAHGWKHRVMTLHAHGFRNQPFPPPFHKQRDGRNLETASMYMIVELISIITPSLTGRFENLLYSPFDG